MSTPNMEKWLPTGPVLTAQDHGRKGIFLPGKFSKSLGFRYSCLQPILWRGTSYADWSRRKRGRAPGDHRW